MYGCVVNKPTNFWGLSLSFNAASLVDCSQDVPLSVMGYHLLRNVLLSFDRAFSLTCVCACAVLIRAWLSILC